MRAWLNGDLMADPTEGVVAVTDHGFTVGDGVFEAIKTVHGRPFALTRHLARLERSAAGLGLPVPDLDDVRRGVEAVLEGEATPRWGGCGSRTRPVRTRWGRAAAAVRPRWSSRGARSSPPPTETTVVTVPWTRNEHGATAGLKTTSYAENVIALAHAVERGGSEAVLANTAGNLCEGTGTNVFYVVDGELRTPSLASGCLAGVTRGLVVEWCGAREVDEPLAEVLARASEAFLVSTTRDVQAIARWDDRDLPAPGPVTRQCAETWAAREAESMDP